MTEKQLLLRGAFQKKISQIVEKVHKQCSNITPDFRSMSGYRTFLSWYVRKASGFTLKVLKLSDNRSWVLIYVCAVIAKVLRWFELGNLQLSEHSDVLPTAYYEMFM